MGGKVTAVGMDVITSESGHQIAPLAPSVCTTPAAPAPVPVPYPVLATSVEGITAAPSRTRINGAKVGTVGGCVSAVHGNEPGTLKEVVSLATGGPAPIMVGAPNVLVELGQTGITGSPCMSNRGPGPGSRTAPAPCMAAASVPSVAVRGGGAGCGDGSGDGNGNGDKASGGGRGSSKHGKGDQKSARSAQSGQCSGGHPVDVVTGRAYTVPAIDLELPGPLPLVLARTWSSDAIRRDVGLGFGWACSWSWEIEARSHELLVWCDEGTCTDFPALAIGAEHVGAWGWTLRRERERFVLDTGEGIRRVFAATDEDARRWKLIELRDRNDNVIELTYDGDGLLCEVTDSAGRTVKVLTTRAGRIASMSVYHARARGQWIAAARYVYDDDGNLTAAIDAEGHARHYQYVAHRLIRETDREGLAFFFAYDHDGRCVETWGEAPGKRDASIAEDVPDKLADGARARGIHHVRLDYHDGMYTEVADSTQIRRYFGNEHGLVDKQVDGIGVEETVYDERGLIVARMDGEQGVWRYERDDRGRIVRVTDPLCRATIYVRDEHGLVVRITDPAHGVHEIHRDERGNVIHASDPTGATWSYTYDARGLMTSSVSPVGAVTHYAYDAAGNLVEQTEANGARRRWEYDLLGRCTLEVDPLGHETRVAWTDRGDVAAVFRGQGWTQRFVYDGERRVTEIQGPGQRTVGLAWGGYGRLVQRTDPTGGIMRSRYNREGELTEVHNELGEVHRLHRNGAGLVVEEQTFDGRRLVYRRDLNGRVVRAEVAGEITDYAYNAAGELVARTLDDETVETFEHDALGALVRATWPGGEVRFERDVAGRVKREVQVFQGEEHTVASFYDPAGGRVRRFTSLGHVEHVERDAMGERTCTILDELNEVHHVRDLLGRETAKTLPRGGRILHEFDPLGRVRRRWATSPGGLRPVRFEDPGWVSGGVPGQPARVTAEREYSYDAAGELSDAFDRPRGWVQYEYDPAGRLLSVLCEAAGEAEAERFRYDAAGNLHEEGRAEGEGRLYGAGGRLLRNGATVHAWDERGRLVGKRTVGEDGAKVWSYTWDAAGRLASVEMPDGRRAEYAYDPFGRRVETRLFEPKPPVGSARLAERTRFVWDGDTIAHAVRTRAAVEGDPIVEERTFCFEDGSFVPWAQCDDVPDGFGGRRHAWSFFVNDPSGAPDALIGGDGSVLAELDRRAWGRTETGEGARAETPLRFQGQHEDEGTGLFYNRFRYYDPDTGLYLSPDPIGLAGGLNTYAFGPSVIHYVDPFGLAGYATWNEFQRGTKGKIEWKNREDAALGWNAYKRTYRDTGKEVVIGSRHDCAAAKQMGMHTLDVPKHSDGINDAHMQGGIDRDAPFYLATNDTAENRAEHKTFNREMNQLAGAGYQRSAGGTYMLLPGGTTP